MLERNRGFVSHRFEANHAAPRDVSAHDTSHRPENLQVGARARLHSIGRFDERAVGRYIDDEDVLSGAKHGGLRPRDAFRCDASVDATLDRNRYSSRHR
jgi:hypothetical protein